MEFLTLVLRILALLSGKGTFFEHAYFKLSVSQFSLMLYRRMVSNVYGCYEKLVNPYKVLRVVSAHMKCSMNVC